MDISNSRLKIQTFRNVYQNLHIRNNITHYIVKSRNVKIISKKYKDIADVEWMIQNKHLGLLKDKLRNQCFLFLLPSSFNLLFSLDLELLKMCLERFKGYIVPTCYSFPCWASHAAFYNNFPVVQYLIEQLHFKSNYLAIENAARSNNIEMFEYLFNLNNTEISIETLEYAVFHQNFDMIKMIIDKKQSINIDFSKSPNQYENIYLKSLFNLDIFKLIVESFPKKTFTSNMFFSSICNKEVFEYLFTSYYDIKYWTTSDIYRQQDISQLIYHCAKNGLLDILKVMYKLNLIQVSFENIAESALSNNQMHVYYYLKSIKPSLSLSNLSISQVKGLIYDYEKLGYFHMELGLKITQDCLFESIKSSFQIFNYVWDHCNLTFKNNNVYYLEDNISDRLVSKCVHFGNLQVLEFFKEKGIFNPECKLVYPSSSLGSNPSSLGILQLMLKDIDWVAYLYAYPILERACISGSINVFVYIFEKVEKNTLRSECLTNLAILASSHNHLSIIKYLVDKKAALFDSVVDNTCKTSFTHILAYLLENNCLYSHRSFLNCCAFGQYRNLKLLSKYSKSVFDKPDILEKGFIASITNHHLKIVDYLISHYKFQNHKDIIPHLIRSGNLNSLQTYLSINQLSDEKINLSIFHISLCAGFLDIAQCFYSKQFLLSTSVMEMVIYRRFVHILEYLATLKGLKFDQGFLVDRAKFKIQDFNHDAHFKFFLEYLLDFNLKHPKLLKFMILK